MRLCVFYSCSRRERGLRDSLRSSSRFNVIPNATNTTANQILQRERPVEQRVQQNAREHWPTNIRSEIYSAGILTTTTLVRNTETTPIAPPSRSTSRAKTQTSHKPARRDPIEKHGMAVQSPQT